MVTALPITGESFKCSTQACFVIAILHCTLGFGAGSHVRIPIPQDGTIKDTTSRSVLLFEMHRHDELALLVLSIVYMYWQPSRAADPSTCRRHYLFLT